MHTPVPEDCGHPHRSQPLKMKTTINPASGLRRQPRPRVHPNLMERSLADRPRKTIPGLKAIFSLELEKSFPRRTFLRWIKLKKLRGG